jgi:hypothetical protein
MESEKWTNDILSSLDNQPRLKAPDYLFDRIESKIKESQVKVININWVIGVAASLLLLVSLNISALKNYSDSTFSQEESIETSSIYYESNQLY